MILWLLAYCFLYLGFSVLSFTNERMYMNSVIKKLNALDRSVMKQQRQGDLLRWLGGPNSVVRHVWGGGVNWRGGRKKKGEWRELPQRSPRYEIGLSSSRSPFLLKKKITKVSQVGQESRKHGHSWSGRPEKSSQRLSAGGAVEIVTACTVLLPPCARACVCLQVFERVPQTRGRRRIKPRKEGWWTIQAVVRHKWWVVVPAWRPSSLVWPVTSCNILRKTQLDRLLFTPDSS